MLMWLIPAIIIEVVFIALSALGIVPWLATALLSFMFAMLVWIYSWTLLIRYKQRKTK